MTISNKSLLLILALALLASAPSQAAGYRRSSYGGGRRAAPVTRGAAGAQSQVQNHNSWTKVNSDGSTTQVQMEENRAPVRGRGMVGYGATRNNYNSAGGSSRGFGGGLRSFGSGGSRFAGSSLRSVGTRYEMAPAGDTGSQTPTGDQPVQGFAVPGALIRTAGLENYYSEPSQPAREHVIAAGTPKLQDNLAYNDTGPGGVFKVQDKQAPVNPGWGTSSGGRDGGTPNSVITGTDGQTFGGTKPNDPSNWNDNKGNGGN